MLRPRAHTGELAACNRAGPLARSVVCSCTVAKRGLPVLKQAANDSSDADGSPDRPPWHWTGFGTVAIFVTWLPLAALGQWFFAGATGPQAAEAGSARPAAFMGFVLTQLAGFLLASFLGGALLGRYGGKAGPREAAASGFAVGLIAVLLALVTSQQVSWTYLIFLTLPTLFAFFGGKVGVRRRVHH
jgi:hypothetical protein